MILTTLSFQVRQLRYLGALIVLTATLAAACGGGNGAGDGPPPISFTENDGSTTQWECEAPSYDGAAAEVYATYTNGQSPSRTPAFIKSASFGSNLQERRAWLDECRALSPDW